jgi:hypothetical protein
MPVTSPARHINIPNFLINFFAIISPLFFLADQQVGLKNFIPAGCG